MNNSGIYVRVQLLIVYYLNLLYNVIYNVIISSSKPPFFCGVVFNVSFRWLYMSYISHGISSRFQVPNLGISHHQSLDVAPPAPALNMESSASLSLGIIGT